MDRLTRILIETAGLVLVLLVLACGTLAGMAYHYHEGREEWRAAAAQWQGQYQQLVAQLQAAQQRAQQQSNTP